MEQLAQLINDICFMVIEFCKMIIEGVITSKDIFFSPWILIIPLFVIAISGIASFK